MLEKFCLETMFCSFVHSEMFFIRRSTRAVKTFSLGFKSKLCNFYMSFLIYQKTYVFHSTVDSQFLKFIRLTTASAFFASFWHFVTSKKQMICNSIITYNQKYVLSRPQHKESKLLASLVYFSNQLKLVYGPFRKRNIPSTLDFCPRSARKEINVPLHRGS